MGYCSIFNKDIEKKKRNESNRKTINLLTQRIETRGYYHYPARWQCLVYLRQVCEVEVRSKCGIKL